FFFSSRRRHTRFSRDWSSDVCSSDLLSGSGNGVAFNGTSFNVTITEPLVLNGDCRFITKGKAEVTPSGMSTRTIDFGDGTCDTEVGIVINGVTYYRNMQ